MIENHPSDLRVNLQKTDVCQTLSARCGTGGGNVPLILFQQDGIGRYSEAKDKAPCVKVSSDLNGGGGVIILTVCETPQNRQRTDQRFANESISKDNRGIVRE